MPTMLLCHDTAFARFRLTWGWDDAIPLHMRGMTAEYDSAEHAFQALRSADVATAIAFESGGLVSPALMDRWPKASYLKTRARVDKSQLARSGFGEVARRIGRMPSAVADAAFGLRLRPGFLPRRFLALWLPIWKAKFRQNAAHARALRLSTRKRLVAVRRLILLPTTTTSTRSVDAVVSSSSSENEEEDEDADTNPNLNEALSL